MLRMGNEKKRWSLRKMHWKIIQILLFVAGIILVLLGISIIFFSPRIINSKIRQHKNVAQGSELLLYWEDPDYKLTSNIYVYSVKNPDEILNGSKPEVISVGPYAYQIREDKKILGFGNGTVTYQNIHNITFDANASCAECLQRRKIWIPNIIYQKFIEVASNPLTSMAQTALSSQTAFLKVAVEDILFKGYKDPYFKSVCTIPLMDLICETIIELPEKIGFLMHRNGLQKVTEISTGEFDGGATAGNIIRWDGQKLLPENWWDSIQARKINGTDGGLYRPLIKKDDILYVFVPDLCRSIHVTFAEEFEYKGIPAYRFTAKEDLLDPEIPGNEGFCHESEKVLFSGGGKCLPKGLLDISHCYNGTPPIVFSFPNFLFASDEVKESVIGLNESSVTHDDIIIDLEPQTGTLLRAWTRSQVNIVMWKGKGITYGADLSRMRNGIVPLFAEFQSVEIGDGSLAALKKNIIFAEQILTYIYFISTFVGILLILAAILPELLPKMGLMKKLMDDSSERVITRITVQPVSNDQKKTVAFKIDS